MNPIHYSGTHAIRCGACHEAFSVDIKIEQADPEKALFLEVDCRWCQKALRLDLKPYLQPVDVFKSSGGAPMTLRLPQEIQGVKK